MRRTKEFVELVRDALGALLLVLIIQSFVVMKIDIPSNSMVPTIRPGDHMVVSYLPLYYRDPMQGEIVVFKEDGIQMIKRVIACPGQEVDIREGAVYVDGVYQQEDYLEMQGVTEPFYRETEVTFPYTVPEETYFMMGDNRMSSRDSRYYGPIHRTQMLTVGGVRIYPFNRISKVK